MEATNKTIVNGLKKRLGGVKGNWAKEFPSVLWAYRTTPRRSTGETHFSMTYGAKAVILVEISMPSMKIASFSPGNNNAQMSKNLDFLEERRDMASIQLANYQQKLAQEYNRNVKPKEFVSGDLVLRKAIESMKDQNVGKLTLN